MNEGLKVISRVSELRFWGFFIPKRQLHLLVSLLMSIFQKTGGPSSSGVASLTRKPGIYQRQALSSWS